MPNTTTPQPIHGLRVLSPQQAHDAGFASITTDICEAMEHRILASVCQHRCPDRACLIRTGTTSYQLAILREDVRGGE
jgi:hypothetical protein